MAMHWLKRNLWKAGIVVPSMLLLLALMVWLPASVAGAYERVSGPTMSRTATVQATPTEDATVTALNKEKLTQEVQQLKNQNEPDLFGWLRANASILLSTLVVVIGALIGLWRWFGDRQHEREKRAEERFQAAVTGLGDDKEGARIGAAILLRTFLRPGYEQFYTQTFDLAVANLRLPRTSQQPDDPDIPLLLTSLRQALIMVFKEAFPLARDLYSAGRMPLVARGIRLDSAYLEGADLKQVWMPLAYLRNVDLSKAHLCGANLSDTLFIGANLSDADFTGANLSFANLHDTTLDNANFSEADLSCANFGPSLVLSGTKFIKADLQRASLRGAVLDEADFTNANLSETNIEVALSLSYADLHGVKGLTKEQLAACKARGAIIDEDPTTSSSQSTVATPSPEPRKDVQASSTSSAQGSLPIPDVGGSSAASPQQSSEP